jgi:hypothetical protein
LAGGLVTTDGLVLLPTGTSSTGAWAAKLTEGPKVKLGARRCTSEGLELKLEVVLGPTERPEGAAVLGLTEGLELKLGDELGPVLPEGTSCADAQTDKNDSNNENFIAVKFGIDTTKWVGMFWIWFLVTYGA